MTEHLGHGKNELIVSDIKVAYRLGCLASSSVGAIHSAYCCTTCPSSDMRSLKAPHDGHKTESSIPGVTTLGVIPPRRPLRGLESPTLDAVPAAPESLPRAGICGNLSKELHSRTDRKTGLVHYISLVL